MSLPPNIRVNARVNFPTLVSGAAFISVAKSNGKWTITPNFLALQNVSPSADYVIPVQDQNTGQFAAIPLNYISSTVIEDYLNSLPTTEPASSGQWWINGGVLMKS